MPEISGLVEESFVKSVTQSEVSLRRKDRVLAWCHITTSNSVKYNYFTQRRSFCFTGMASLSPPIELFSMGKRLI